MSAQDRSARATRMLRVAMLMVIALVALANGAGWVDADLWIPFVCIIAVMGIGTRGGPVDALSFVLIEASVVVVLGVATFGGSRDGVWAASVAVSVLAIGKIAMVELHRRDEARDQKADRREAESVEAHHREREAERLREEGVAVAEPDLPAAPRGPRAVSEAPPAPMSPAPPPSPAASPSAETSTSDSSAPRTRKRRDRNDPTPKSVPISRPR